MDLGVATITNAAGLNIKTATNIAGGTITNNYGIRVENQTAGASDYGLYIEGADTYALWVDSGASRLDGTLTVAEHAAIGAGAIIDGITVTSPVLGGSTFSSVLTVAEDITDFSKDLAVGTTNVLTASPSSPYNGAILGMGNEVAVGGSESVGDIAGSVSWVSTGDSVVASTIYGSMNQVLLGSSGDVSSGAIGEINILQTNTDITGAVYGSMNQVYVNGTGGGAAAGIYQIDAYGNSDTVLGVGTYNHIGSGTVTNQQGMTITLGSTAGATVATSVGLDILDVTHAATVTDSYGLRVGTMSGATNNYGLYVEGADTYALWVDDGVSRFDGNLEVDTDTLFVDATANRVGIGTATPSAKLHVVESSTSAVVDALTGAYIQVTDTGAVNGGLDITAGLAVRASRTGAIDGIFVTNGAQFESDGDTAGNSLVQGINAWARGGDNSNGVNGVATVTGSGTYASIVGVQGSASVYLASDAAVTDAVGLQGSVSNTSSAAYTNGVGLNIKTAVNSGAGSITNNYGLRVENQTAGASNYGLYIEGASTYGIWVDSGVSRFDGNVAINATAASNKLNLNTLTTADAAAQLAVSTDGTGNKGVIVQGVASQTADLFQAQDSTGAVLASISATGDLTVETATINGALTVNGNATINGHVISGNTSGSTTVVAGAAADCSASGLANISGNDTAGTITITTSTGACAAGTLATITFADAYGSAPEVVITPKDASGASLQYYNGSATTAVFTIDTGVGATASTVYTYSYHVIE